MNNVHEECYSYDYKVSYNPISLQEALTKNNQIIKDLHNEAENNNAHVDDLQLKLRLCFEYADF